MKELSGARLLLIALVCGLLAAGLTMLYLNQVENKYRLANQPKQVKKVAVVVPKVNLNKGAVISAKTVASRKVPAEFLPSGAILSKDFKKVENRTVLMAVQKGRPLTWSAVTGKSIKTFSGNVEIGRRAKSIKVSKIDSFDGLLRPGDKIDLMGQFNQSDLGLATSAASDLSDDIIMPVLENVEVLAAGREDLNGRRYELTKQKNSADGFNMEFGIISLNLSPKQIARLELAESIGSVFAVLRHPKDTSLVDYDYLGAELLLEKPQDEPVDMVLDENGKPIGRVVGDNIVDADGNIVGKIVDGKAVGFDGKPIGQVVKNVDPDDPINRVAEVADVVRDANGNIIGRVVDGKVVDAEGNVVGSIDASGRAVAADGTVLGKVENNIALDEYGNEVKLTDSSASLSKTRRQQVVRDASGKVIGRVVNGQVVDADGKVIGKLDANGNPVSLTGKKLGTVAESLIDRSGNIVASETQVVRDANGNIIGRVVDGKVVDENGKVIGMVGPDGVPVGMDGKPLGTLDTVMLGEDGSIKGEVAEVLKDKDGNIIGRVVNGKVIDADGNVVGVVDKDGSVISASGEVLGTVEKVVTDADGRLLEPGVEVVRDANGNVIGKLVNGEVVDADGNVVGKLVNGKVVDANGVVVASGVSVDAEDAVALAAEIVKQQQQTITSSIKVIDFIAGGTAKDGVVPVQKIRLE